MRACRYVIGDMTVDPDGFTYMLESITGANDNWVQVPAELRALAADAAGEFDKAVSPRLGAQLDPETYAGKCSPDWNTNGAVDK